MLRRLLVPLLAAMLVIWAGLASLSPAAAEPVFPPGLRIGLEPPPGMVVSRQFPGFEDADNKVAITLLEFPLTAYDQIEQSIFGKVPPGLTVQKREMFPFGNGIGFLLSGNAQPDGATLHKWFLLARAIGGANFDLTAFVNVDVPEKARGIYTDEVVRAALASVTLRPPPLAEQIAMLPFKLGELAGFRVMQAMAEGGVILTDGPTDDINRQPYMIVSVGRSALTEPNDRGTLARELLSSAPLRDLSITLAEAMRIGGRPGYEIRAQAKGLNGEPVSIVQWVRFGSGGYLRIVGVGRKNDWDALFTRFRAVRDGIDLR